MAKGNTPDTPNLRTWMPKASQAKNVEDTDMLRTDAREPLAYTQGDDSQNEDTNSTPDFGTLGAQGRS